MALPKILLRILKPYLILLVVGMVYLAYQQFKSSEQNAYQQSFANLKTSSQLISAQIEAAASKLYLLDESENYSDFVTTAQRFLKHTSVYSDIYYFDKTKQKIQSMANQPLNSDTLNAVVWNSLSKLSPKLELSSIYEKQPGDWAVAVRYTPDSMYQIWIEFDLFHATQNMRGLKTLNHGYVFVVDKTTGRLVFHPNPERIGTPSISYHGGISELVDSGRKFGTQEYYYKDQFKISAFDADNQLNWVFISGTDRSDILATSYQFSLTAIVIASLLFLAVVFNYLTYQLNLSLVMLNQKENVADFKLHLKTILDRFCHHDGIQFCLYDADYGHFSTVDYHGNTKVVLTNPDLAKRFTPHSFNYLGKQDADPLAKTLKVKGRHYSIPLFDNDRLIAVLYMKAIFPTYRSILTMVRNYSEVALSNLLLHKQLRSKDVMTHLDNKLTIRDVLEQHLHTEQVYFALIDIDHFKRINDNHGHQCGDHVILHTADLMQKCFTKPGALSLARYGGEEFCVLFHANDENDAYEQCEMLRHLAEKAIIEHENEEVKFTISIGITSAEESQHATIGRADKALFQAKGLGRNQVVLNTF
ncbi:diguanylate cyclase [Vibrio sp. NTOU-M3]|uniref:sensor domain-containing diguanylate cyclase n=1 Tax=Vibrio sp. NTOU-M3 TaxID=3234954 RepID=UPI00349F765D